MKNVEQRVNKVIAEQVGVDESDITNEMNFEADLKLNDLDMIGLVIGLEDEFDIELSDYQVSRMTTVQRAVDLVHKCQVKEGADFSVAERLDPGQPSALPGGASWKPVFDESGLSLESCPTVLEIKGDDLVDALIGGELSLKISGGEDEIQKISLPCDGAAPFHAIDIEYLPSLVEIKICQSAKSPPLFLTHWIDISNAPLLRTITIKSNACRLRISSAPSLVTLNLKGCKRLDQVILERVGDHIEFNVQGCGKLRSIKYVEISTLSGRREVGAVRHDGFSEQIRNNQERSRKNDSLYSSMTFTDVDRVLKLINDGVKSLSRAGIASECGSILGKYGINALDESFIPFRYELLRPFEEVYNGGSGEVCPYKLIVKGVDSDGVSALIIEEIGHESPEDCLRAMLHWTRMSLKGVVSSKISKRISSDNGLLRILKTAIGEAPSSTILSPPIRLSQKITKAERNILVQLAGEVGIKILDKEAANYACVIRDRPSRGYDELASKADYTVRFSSAVKQMRALKDWAQRKSVE